MRVENIILDSRDPAVAGRFLAAALGATVGHADDGYVELRVEVADAWWYDVCVVRVPDARPVAPRARLDLHGGEAHEAVVARLLGLGARRRDGGPGDVPGVLLEAPDGLVCRVLEAQAAHPATGPVAAIGLDSADPARDLRFWRELTGWDEVDGTGVPTLRHPSRAGFLLEFLPERGPKQGKNPLHLDVRLEVHDDRDAEVARALDLGGHRVDHPGAVDVPWTVMTDPSGNELCLLHHRSDHAADA